MDTHEEPLLNTFTPFAHSSQHSKQGTMANIQSFRNKKIKNMFKKVNYKTG